MEDDLKTLAIEYDIICFLNMEDGLNIFLKGRLPQYFGKRKKTSMFFQLEHNLNFLLGKASLASPSLFWAWHSSAPAC